MAKPGDIVNQPDTDFEDVVADLSSSNVPIKTMADLENMINSIIATIPRLNRNALRKEMENMQVDLKQNPHSSDLNKGLAVAQSYKDRLAEIYTMALREYKTRNRCVDMLIGAFIATEAKGKSADARQGEAALRYPMHLFNLEAAESFMKEVEHILQNVKSAHEAISRQVSVTQIQLQLGEIRREIPNSNYNREAEEITPRGKTGETDWNSF
ncbi:hypothetical protein D3C81_742250 [compost metagenome]